MSEKLNLDMVGKHFNVIILDTDDGKTKQERCCQLIHQYAFALPESYRFNWDTLYTQ